MDITDCGMERQIWDPLRKKSVALTPEEEVRQWIISVLHEQSGVPYHAMMSETSFKYGKKTFRADLIIWDRALAPAVVVECKRPEVALDSEVLSQALRYDLALEVRWIIITNGNSTAVFYRDKGAYTRTDRLPLYSEIRMR